MRMGITDGSNKLPKQKKSKRPIVTHVAESGSEKVLGFPNMIVSDVSPALCTSKEMYYEERGMSLEPVQLRHKFPILNLHCLYVLCFSLPSPSDFKFDTNRWCRPLMFFPHGRTFYCTTLSLPCLACIPCLYIYNPSRYSVLFAKP